jgi:lipopolysaccharide export system protein LptA
MKGFTEGPMQGLRRMPRLARPRFVVLAAPAAAILAVVAVAPAFSAPAPADGAQPAGLFGASKEPLDISSDNSDYQQQARKGIWWGSVEAIQGTARLRTPRLTVFFAPRDPSAPKPPPGAAGPDVGQVERVEAEGPVFYTTPTQRATGDHATYVSADDTITMTGNVVVVQDKNVATGDKLVIEQKTGHSTLSSTPGKPTGKPRVRAVFYPSQGAPAAPGAAAVPAVPPKAPLPAKAPVKP